MDPKLGARRFQTFESTGENSHVDPRRGSALDATAATSRSERPLGAGGSSPTSDTSRTKVGWIQHCALVRFLGSTARVPGDATGPTETCKRTKRRRGARLAF
eukprot:scaffold502_cov350-Pavlova_lutheri.AAC.4